MAFCSALRKIPTLALVCGTASASPRGANRFAHQTKNTDHKGRGGSWVLLCGEIFLLIVPLWFLDGFLLRITQDTNARVGMRHSVGFATRCQQLHSPNKNTDHKGRGEAGYCYAGKCFCLLFRFVFEAAFCSALRKIPTHALVCGTASASPRGANSFTHQIKIPTTRVGIFIWWGKLDSDQRSQ